MWLLFLILALVGCSAAAAKPSAYRVAEAAAQCVGKRVQLCDLLDKKLDAASKKDIEKAIIDDYVEFGLQLGVVLMPSLNISKIVAESDDLKAKKYADALRSR